MKYMVTLNEKKYEVEVEKVESGFKPIPREKVAATQVMENYTPQQGHAEDTVQTKSKIQSPTAGSCNVTSPMPGTVLDIKVSQGEKVKAGQVLLLLEAMKMENEIVAPMDAAVASIPVKTGSAVDTDQILMVLK